MADEKSTGLGAAKCLTTFDEDERDQAVVLHQVLELHPASLTQGELTREMTGAGGQALTDAEGIERALRELAGTGLLHRPGGGGFIRATRAAVRYFELSGGAL